MAFEPIAEARKNAPMILNFDEFDALVPDRGRTDSVHVSGEVNEFLSLMNSCGKDRVFVIASSNRPDLIDPAVRRKGRLDQLIYIPVPDAAAREGMFRVQMKGRPQEEGIDFSRLASLTENYVSADIAFIVNDAAEKAFRSRSSRFSASSAATASGRRTICAARFPKRRKRSSRLSSRRLSTATRSAAFPAQSQTVCRRRRRRRSIGTFWTLQTMHLTRHTRYATQWCLIKRHI